MKRSWRPLSLSTLLSLVLTLFFAATLAFFIGYQFHNETQRFRQQALTHVNNTLAYLQSQLNHEIAEGDFTSVRSMLAELGLQHGIAALFVIDPQDRLLFSPRRDWNAQPASTLLPTFDPRLMQRVRETWQPLLQQHDPDHIYAYYPLSLPPLPGALRPGKGGIFMHYDLSHMRSRIWHATYQQSAAVGLFAVLAGLLLGWLLKRLVSAPLQRLASHARRLAKGHLWLRAPQSRNHELQQLGNALNAMADELQESYTHLISQKNLYNALSHTNQAIVRLSDPAALFHEVCRITVEHGRFPACWLALLEQGRLHPVAQQGVSARQAHLLSQNLAATEHEAQHLLQSMTENRHLILNRHVRLEDNHYPSAALFPIHRDGQLHGALMVYAPSEDVFSDDLIALLHEMTSDLSFALDNLAREQERQRQAEQLAAIQSKLQHVITVSPAITYLQALDPHGNPQAPLYIGGRIQALTGHSEERFQAGLEDWLRLIHPQDRAGVAARYRQRDCLEAMTLEYRILHRDGDIRWIYESRRLIRNEQNGLQEIVGSWMDITASKRAQERIDFLAHYDNLTGLPNRHQLMEQLKQFIQGSDATHIGALLLLDLDSFKAVNDALGHAIGDMLLQETANRLRAAIWDREDVSVVARLGGDEFALLCPLPAQDEAAAFAAARALAERLRDALHAPFLLAEHQLHVTPCIGIALFMETGLAAEEILQQADTALSQAKQQGRDQIELFVPRMKEQTQEKLALENELRHALSAGEQLALYYQPQIDLRTGQLVGAEALLRWHHPVRGTIPPFKFIPLAEESGLILPLGEWVLEEACRFNRQLIEQLDLHIPISVNLSVAQFKQAHLLHSITETLRKYQLAPHYLKLELTESMLMDDPEQVLTTLSELRRRGIKIALDDFGTGYSSLGYLKRFPINTIKVDKSFVDQITDVADDLAITRTIINMAHNLGMDTIAEGVESQAQLELLRELGCHRIQGYYYSKPLPAEHFTAFAQTAQAPAPQPSA